MRRVEKKRFARKIARERIDILYALAEQRAREGDFELANRYADLILKLSRKYNIRLSRDIKMRICKKCHAFLVPGKNSTVRLNKGKLVIKCLGCGEYKRYPLH